MAGSDGAQQSRLLILACSRAKRRNSGLLPAIERYDGPIFRVLRRYQRLHPGAPLEVLVLSAELGLINGQQPVPLYDREMTASRAAELQPAVAGGLQHILSTGDYTEVFICMSARYRQVLAISNEFAASETCVAISTSARGKALTDLHCWLYGHRAARVPQR